ncbi:MAG TPA: hypothetical protein VMD59_09745, partial [Acidimicrobiales bacterium]|nr:hypothetical protein [Acidimicrobiales bacterium]
MPTWERSPTVERLRRTFLKPPQPGAAAGRGAAQFDSVEELEEAVRCADDKERMIGLVAAPVAAAIALLVGHLLVSNDPPATLANGVPNKLHVSVSLYDDLLLVLLVLSMGMLGLALWRKRLYLGM